MKESRDPDAFRGIDWTGIALSALGLGGPVFALIEQPTHGWGDPLVWVPLIGGIACFALFVLHEARARHPMLDLGLFRIRNFAIANLTTLTAYAGLIGGLFFVGLFLQQVAGYSPLEAGLATTPVSIVLFFLSPRFGQARLGHRAAAADERSARSSAGSGCCCCCGSAPTPTTSPRCCRAVLVFGLGLSATVAPLTATVLDSVEERHVGIASGVNNGVSRVAGLLAIAVLGAVISAQFGATLDANLGERPLGPAADGDGRRRQGAAAGGARTPAAAGRPRRTRVGRAAADASDLGLPPRHRDRRRC